jgi:hypothetical protein
VPELEQLATLCDGTLAPIKPLLDTALGIARGGRAAPPRR